MDNIIVFILTLVFIAAGILGQKKKKPLVPQPQTEPRPAEDNLWEMLNANRENKRQKVNEPVPTPQKTEEIPSSKNKYEFNPGNEDDRIIQDTIKQDEVKNQTQTARKRKFPLKEAVIYSEILHRKYT